MKPQNGQCGLTLLEMIITMIALMGIVLAVTSTLRSSFDMRQGLSERSQVVHRMAIVIERLAADLRHAFIIPQNDKFRNFTGRSSKTLFRISSTLSGPFLEITTKTHVPIRAGAVESDLTYVTYELRDSQVASGRKDLYRGSVGYIPADFRDQPPMKLLATGVKEVKLEWWNGERWITDRFDSTSRDTRSTMPRLVRVTVEVWTQERSDDDGLDPAQVDASTDKVNTVVVIPDSINYKQQRDPVASIRWNQF